MNEFIDGMGWDLSTLIDLSLDDKNLVVHADNSSELLDVLNTTNGFTIKHTSKEC